MLRILALLLILSVPTFATQVTMTATTVSNFHPPSLTSPVTGTLTATSGSTTVTGSFRSSWINLGGFRININGADYVVANASSLVSMTLATPYVGATGSKTYTVYPYVLLRFYALQRFTESTTGEIIQPGTPGSSAWYKQLGCSVIGTTLYISQTTLPSTTDALNPGERNAKWYAAFYNPSGGFISVWDGLTSFGLNYVPNPKTWAQAVAYANPGTAPPSNTETYTKPQIDALFHSGGGGGVSSVGTGTGLIGGPITSTGTISLANTAVFPGTYTLATITVDQQGRLTSASTAPNTITAGSCTNCNLSFNSKGQLTLAADGIGGGGGGVTSITAGTGLSGGTITTSGTISITPVISAHSCSSCDLTINALGQVTAATDGAGGGGSGSPSGRWVLRLNGLGESVLPSSLWFSDFNLPACTYEAWINVDPAFSGSGGYIFADGGGGAHAVLFGVGRESTGVRLTGNVCGSGHDTLGNPVATCGGGDTVSYTGNHVFPVGEWHHVAWSWTGTAMELFVDGVPDGYKKYAGPRNTPGGLGGGGPLFIGGSDHNNFLGKIAAVRVWEGIAVYNTVAFPPELSLQADNGTGNYLATYPPSLVYDMSTPGNTLPDLSQGFRGSLHPGLLINSNFAHGNANPPRGTWEYDATAPTTLGSWTPPVGNIPVAPAIPFGAKVWDSFSYPNRTFLNYGCCGILSPYMPPLNNTDAGASLGAKTWQYEGAYVFGPISSWGYFNGKVFNANRYNGAIVMNSAVVDTTVSNGTFCIDREPPEAATGTSTAASTSLFFRYVDVNNHWWLFAPGLGGTSVDEVRVWKVVGGTATQLTTAAGTANWTTLCAVTSGTSISVTTNGTPVYSTTSSDHLTATKAGIGGGIDANFMLFGHAKWDNFLVKMWSRPESDVFGVVSDFGSVVAW